MAVSSPVTNIAYPPGANGGTVMMSNGVSPTWATPNTHFSSSNGQTIMTIPHGEEKIVLEETATLDVKGTVKINGQDLEKRLSTIEQVLQIPTRDIIMEQKHPKLAELYNQYMHELEKYKTWERIKGDDTTT
jgi:hypothetical protein